MASQHPFDIWPIISKQFVALTSGCLLNEPAGQLESKQLAVFWAKTWANVELVHYVSIT